MAEKTLISIKDLDFSYINVVRGECVKKQALKNINIDIYEGEILLIMGPSGSGKTTLLRNMKDEAIPFGEKTGEIKSEEDSRKIAIVFSNPETQLVTSSVLNDLALSMENLGYDNYTQKKRMSETVSFFGIEDLLHRVPDTLSGGQKQMITLCEQLMVRPNILLLDEPISQLDPISAVNFIDTLRRLNEELGITIVMTEHRPDEVISMAHRMVYMENGEILYSGTKEAVLKQLWTSDDTKQRDFIPVVSKCSLLLDKETKPCVTPKELKLMVSGMDIKVDADLKKPGLNLKSDVIIRLREIFFSYDREHFALRNLSLDVYKGEFLCVMGSNGSGKSTLLKVICGILKAYMGSVKSKFEKIQFLPQDLNSFFTEDTIIEETVFKGMDEDLYRKLVKELDLIDILYKHPYDLSGGEQQKAVLACILLRKPDMIIMDEPTKSMDPSLKHVVAKLLKESGATVMCATHDLEFAACYATRCVMLFNGEIAYSLEGREFFKENRYYTTSVSRAFRQIDSDMVLYEDVAQAFGREAE